MIGKIGIVIERCAPEGLVRIGQEIWKCKSLTGTIFNQGEEIVVVSRDGFSLTVDAVVSHGQNEIKSVSKETKIKKVTKAILDKTALILMILRNTFTMPHDLSFPRRRESRNILKILDPRVKPEDDRYEA
ncbi:MAG: hypothetical protein EPN22_02090, partial [Nitrospirae bacterium]